MTAHLRLSFIFFALIMAACSGGGSKESTHENSAPFASANSFNGVEDQSLSGQLEGHDADGDELNFTLASLPDNGSISLESNGSFTFTPSENFNGTSTFSFSVSDGKASSPAATVTILIAPANDTPTAVDDSLIMREDTTESISVLENDTDIDGDNLSLLSVDTPAHGKATISGATIHYEPDADFFGNDSFSYAVQDPAGAIATAIVNITINNVDQVIYQVGERGSFKMPLFLGSTASPATDVRLTPAGTYPSVRSSFSLIGSGRDRRILFTKDTNIINNDLVEIRLDTPGVVNLVAENVSGGEGNAIFPAFNLVPKLSTVVYWTSGNGSPESLSKAIYGQPATATHLLTPFDSANVDNLKILLSPDGTNVLAMADFDVPSCFELYMIDIATGARTKLTPPLVSGRSLVAALPFQAPQFSADGKSIYYLANQDDQSKVELYSVMLAHPGVSTKLSPQGLGTSSSVQSFGVSSNGRVIVVGDLTVEGQHRIYVIDPVVPGIAFDVSPALLPVGKVYDQPVYSSDNVVVFAADTDTQNAPRLFVSTNLPPSAGVMLNSPLVPGGRIENGKFNLTADGQRAFYIARQDAAGITDLYFAETDRPGVSTKLNRSQTHDIGVDKFTFSADGKRVAYVGSDGFANYALWFTNIDNPGTVIRLSGSLTGMIFYGGSPIILMAE